MNSIRNNQQPKLIRKDSVYSLILGAISLTLPNIIIVWQASIIKGSLGYSLWYGTGLGGGSAKLFFLGMIVAGLCGILGLNFGIKGLKSIRRKLAIVGIIVFAISLLLWMGILLIWLMGGGLIWLDLL